MQQAFSPMTCGGTAFPPLSVLWSKEHVKQCCAVVAQPAMWRILPYALRSYGRQSVDQFVLVLGSPLGPMTRFYPHPYSSDNCFVVLPVGRLLWREDGSVTYNAIADWSGHWGRITIHYRLIWDCVPSSSPLTTRRDCGGGILTRLHTGMPYASTSSQLIRKGGARHPITRVGFKNLRIQETFTS
jgi:hypothetical protein